jgi:hypothetical protein
MHFIGDRRSIGGGFSLAGMRVLSFFGWVLCDYFWHADCLYWMLYMNDLS